jgi:hypothetical protein
MSNIDLSEEEIIKKIFTWSLLDIVHKPDGYDRKTLPKATSNNMLIYMEKINELVAEVNNLKRINSGLTDALKNRKL